MPRHRLYRVLAATVVPLLLGSFEVRAGAVPAHLPSQIRGVTPGCGHWTVVPRRTSG